MDIRLAVITLRAEDVQATAHFYREVLGLTPLPHHPEDRPHFKLGEAYLAIIRGRPALPPDSEPPFPVVAFSVSDLDATIKKLQLHHVDLPQDVESNPAGRWILLHDPAGNLIELVEWTAC